MRPLAAADRLDSQAHGKVGFSDTGRAEEIDVLAVGHPATGGEFLDLLWV